MIKTITKCRICKSKNLEEIISLGEQFLTGVFPKNKKEKVLKAPLTLIHCGKCGLLQLRESVKRELLYGPTYGYRSGINQSMILHLQRIVQKATSHVHLEPWDAVIDIGSNDGTLLKMYNPELNRIGVDPLGKKFQNYYPWNIKIIPQYFSSKKLPKAKIITSIAMFYDLEDPLEFMREVKRTLKPDGIWITEQAYMPTMIRKTAYDVICHEHLEYYGLSQIKWMTDKLGLKIIDISLNDINAGSFCLTIAKRGKEATAKIEKLLKQEQHINFTRFVKKVNEHRVELKEYLEFLVEHEHKVVMGYGASTKGNVILQYADIGKYLIAIADRNEEKYGCVTPGTHIPIIPEAKMRLAKPDYLLVLPYHFRKGFIDREWKYLLDGGKMIFPLPEMEIYPNEIYEPTYYTT